MEEIEHGLWRFITLYLSEIICYNVMKSLRESYQVPTALLDMSKKALMSDKCNDGFGKKVAACKFSSKVCHS